MYRCKDCDNENLVVERTYIAKLDGTINKYHDRGWLDDSHHVEWDETWDEIERDIGDSHMLEEGKVDSKNDDWYIFCGGCQREIPFGWGVYDPAYGYGGRIWPFDCEEIEGHMYPDPKYLSLVYP